MAVGLTSRAIAATIEQLRAESVSTGGVPVTVSYRAARATAKAVGTECDKGRAVRRARAYYWAVVRKELARTSAAPDVTARFVLSTVVQDLAAVGREPSSIWEELVCGWSSVVPAHVLEEYRPQACA